MAAAPRHPHKPSGEDRFVVTTLAFLAWAQRNSRALVLAVIALGILGAGVIYYLDYERRVREVASAEIRTIRFELRSGNTAQAAERLRSFLIQFDGSPYAREARVLLAHSLLLQNRAAEAIEPARQAAEGRVGKDVLATRAAFLLAAAYEEVGDTASAIDVYEEIGRRASLRVDKSRGLEGAARLREARGDRASAAALYQQLVELTPEGSSMKSYYEMRAAELDLEPISRAGAAPEGA